MTKKYRRSPVLVAVFSLFAIVDVYKIALNIGLISGNSQFVVKLNMNIFFYFTKIFIISQQVIYIPFVPNPLHGIIQIAVILVDVLLLYICITKLEKRAFQAYIGLTALIAVMQIPGPVLTSYALTAFILKGILLFALYLTDVRRWEETH